MTPASPNPRLLVVVGLAVTVLIASAFAVGLAFGSDDMVVEASPALLAEEAASPNSFTRSPVTTSAQDLARPESTDTTSGTAASTTVPLPTLGVLFDRPVRRFVGALNRSLVIEANDGSVHVVSVDGRTVHELSPPSAKGVAMDPATGNVMVISDRDAIEYVLGGEPNEAVEIRRDTYSVPLVAVTAEAGGGFVVLDIAGRRWSDDGVRTDVDNWTDVIESELSGLGDGWFSAWPSDVSESLFLISPAGTVEDCEAVPAALLVDVSDDQLTLSDGSARDPRRCAITIDQGPVLLDEVAVALRDRLPIAALVETPGGLALLQLPEESTLLETTFEANQLLAPFPDGLLLLGPSGAAWLQQ